MRVRTSMPVLLAAAMTANAQNPPTEAVSKDRLAKEKSAKKEAAVKNSNARQPAILLTDAQKQATADLREYFRRCTAQIERNALADIRTPGDWQARRLELRRQLQEMLGLDPMPERGELKGVVTGKVERPGIVVEKLHFQSLPGLYVTANFYRPEKVEKPLPAILYLCGHGRVKIDGVSCGNKTHYQHHGVWFARNGYCCLMIDTVQLGEIEGEHHGTYRLGQWSWFSRGYTPAGVEAWNAIRALDYLESRSEVDSRKIGVTGRSGGGIYSWWVAALDDRPACFAPVAGITDLENYVVDDCIEGHCDCMFMANRYGWDYPMVAALAAPRPVLFCNSDKDRIFPLTGVQRTHAKVKQVYRLLGADDKLGLVITEGPHSDTQELQVPVFRWMNRWLKDVKDPVYPVADPPIPPMELRVFDKIPADEIVTKIQDRFVLRAKPGPPPSDLEAWISARDAYRKELREQTFRNWPSPPVDLDLKKLKAKSSNGLVLEAFEYASDENLRLPFFMMRGEAHTHPEIVVVTVVDEKGWQDWLSSCDREFGDIVPAIAGTALHADSNELKRRMLEKNAWAFVTVPARGIGPTQWNPNPQAHTHLLRRFYLLGKTVDDGRVWDVRRVIEALDSLPALKGSRFWLQGDGQAAGIALYAGLDLPRIERFDLHHLPRTHLEGPHFLNVLKVLDVPQTVALAFPRRVVLYDVAETDFAWPAAVAKLFVKDGKMPLEFRKMPERKAN